MVLLPTPAFRAMALDSDVPRNAFPSQSEGGGYDVLSPIRCFSVRPRVFDSVIDSYKPQGYVAKNGIKSTQVPRPLRCMFTRKFQSPWGGGFRSFSFLSSG